MKSNLFLATSTAFALATATTILPLTSVHADAGHSHGATAPTGHAESGPAGSFSSIGQAWKVVTSGIEGSSKAIAAGDLKPIHEATEQMDGAIKYLQAAGGINDNDKKMRADAALKQMLGLSGELHVAADAGDATKSAQALKKLQGAMKLVEIQFPAEALVAPVNMGGMEGMSHGDGHSASASVATTKVSVTTEKPLTVGQKSTATVKLTKPDGSPMLLSDLKEAHTEKIHLLINDPSLSDYHHEHPTATAIPGEYTFTFTPSKPGPYRIWADLVPVANDAQEYAIADLAAPTKGEPISNRTPSTTTEVDGLKFAVTFEKPTLKAGEAVLGKLTITKADASPFNELEPVMGAYSHIVGFSEDFNTIAHIHPMGAEPTKPTDRGAGELEFHLLPAKPGLMRLYAQIRVNGQDRFAPFTLEIQP
jgi:hypothetical protein